MKYTTKVFSDVVKTDVKFRLTAKNPTKLPRTAKNINERKKQIKLKHCSYINASDTSLVILDANRNIRKDKVQNIIESMAIDGCPTTILLVKDGDKFIMADGQHRASACFYLKYDIPYSYVDINDLHVDVLTFISNLNTGQSNWTSKDYIDLGKRLDKVEKKRIYEILDDFVDSVKGFGKDHAVKIMFNLPAMSLKGISRISDMKSFMYDQDLTFTKMMKNVRHFQYIGNRAIDIFGIENQAYFFIKGFCEFVMFVGLYNVMEDGFIKYLQNNANKYYWDTSDPAPQSQSQWKSFFQVQWNDYQME